MNGYNFTERVRTILALARQEAERFNHEYVGTEHILLGLIREGEDGHGEGVATRVLRSLGANPADIRRKIDETLRSGTKHATGPDLPYTARAKKVLELAMTEARDLHHNYVGSEHVLLGLLREEKGIAAQSLNAAGITRDKARAETLRILGQPAPGREGTRTAGVEVKGVETVTDSHRKWSPDRPHTLVIACSDGRLQEQTDDFLHNHLGLKGFDRFYVPGGGGALASSGRDFLRATQLRHECAYLIELHEISRVILLFHGPSPTGPAQAVCADYKRKMPWASPGMLRDQQKRDAADLIQRRDEWAGKSDVVAYLCEIDASHDIAFAELTD